MTLTIIVLERRKRRWAGWRPLNDEAKLDFKEAVMKKKEEDQQEDLETIQKSTEEAATKVEHPPRSHKGVRRTPEDVMVKEGAVARCTQAIKRRSSRNKQGKPGPIMSCVA